MKAGKKVVAEIWMATEEWKNFHWTNWINLWFFMFGSCIRYKYE